MEKAKLNALAVRARDGREETLLDLWNAVKGFVKKKAVYYAKNHTAGMTTAEDLVQAGFFAVYDTVKAFDETREKSFLTLLKYFLQKRFADVPIDAVYSSDLFRTMTTARAIYVPKGLPLHTDPQLREINLGDWEDQTWGQVRHFDPAGMAAFNRSDPAWRAPGGESLAEADFCPSPAAR